MKIRKLLLTCTAIAGISAAFAVAANAEPITNNTYDKTAGTVSVATDLKGYAGDQMTVIVIPESAYTSNSIADADILYIDQEAAKADSNIFQGMGVKGGKLDPGTYYIKVGGTNIAADGIIVEKIVVAADGKIYHYGNIVGDYVDESSIDLLDAMQIIYYAAGADECVFYDYFDEVGNINSNDWIWKAANLVGTFEDESSVDLLDAMQIIYYAAGADECVFYDHFDEDGNYSWEFRQ